MKNKTPKGGGNGKKNNAATAFNKELEKTGFEKFEDDLKGTIFNVLYVLLKDDETSHWKHILEILIDFMQIYHFSFAHAVINTVSIHSNYRCIFLGNQIMNCITFKPSLIFSKFQLG